MKKLSAQELDQKLTEWYKEFHEKHKDLLIKKPAEYNQLARKYIEEKRIEYLYFKKD